MLSFNEKKMNVTYVMCEFSMKNKYELKKKHMVRRLLLLLLLIIVVVIND
jgi:hypothetical protein